MIISRFLQLVALMLILGHPCMAQDANTVIQHVKQQFDNLNNYKITFQLTTEIPESENITYKGTLIASGNKFYIDLKDQALISDGQVFYTHLKDRNEVHIMTIDDSQGDNVLSPKAIFEQYNGGAYEKRYVGSSNFGTGTLEQVEFIPKDKASETFKMRLSVDQKTQEVKRFKIFNRDGTRQILELTSIVNDIKVAPDQFSFNVDDHPGIHVEDLR